MIYNIFFDDKLAKVSTHGWFTIWSLVDDPQAGSPQVTRCVEMISAGDAAEIGLHFIIEADCLVDDLDEHNLDLTRERLTDFWKSLTPEQHKERAKEREPASDESDLYDTAHPEKRAAVEAIDATSLPSTGDGPSIVPDTEYLQPLQQKLAKLLAIITTEGRSRIGKNEKRTRRHIEYIKAYVENLPNLFADSFCATEDGCDYVDYDYLLDLESDLDELIAAESALRSRIGRATSFVIEPLDDGDVLIRFRGDWVDGGWSSSGAQILSRDCFDALAKADPERKRIVNPIANRWLRPHRSKRRFRVDTAIVVQSESGKRLEDGDWRHTGVFECLEASLRNGCFTEIPDVPRVADVVTTDDEPLIASDEILADFGIPRSYRVECEIEVEIDADDSLEDAMKYGNWEPNNVQAAIENAIQQGKYCKIEDDESAYFLGVLLPGTATKNEDTD
jgi:hypothetical protein